MKESHVLIITALLNAAVAVIKLLTGVAFSFSTLIADSIQSFIDFFTDIVSLVANRIGKRRANKTYPFGYGQVYYLSNILTGLLLFFIGVFIVYQVIAVDNKFICRHYFTNFVFVNATSEHLYEQYAIKTSAYRCYYDD